MVGGGGAGIPVSPCRGLMLFVLIANDNAMDRSPHEDRLSPIQASQGSPGTFLASPDSCHSWFLLSLSLGYGWVRTLPIGHLESQSQASPPPVWMRLPGGSYVQDTHGFSFCPQPEL